ncbi:hypothetical protein Q4S25_18075, partial [Morganella morganii]
KIVEFNVDPHHKNGIIPPSKQNTLTNLIQKQEFIMKSIKTFFSNLTRAAAIIAKYSKAF